MFCGGGGRGAEGQVRRMGLMPSMLVGGGGRVEGRELCFVGVGAGGLKDR